MNANQSLKLTAIPEVLSVLGNNTYIDIGFNDRGRRRYVCIADVIQQFNQHSDIIAPQRSSNPLRVHTEGIYKPLLYTRIQSQQIK